MFWMCPAVVPPLKAKVTTRTTMQITSRSGVATKDMMTMPRAGTRKDRAVFALKKVKIDFHQNKSIMFALEKI